MFRRRSTTSPPSLTSGIDFTRIVSTFTARFEFSKHRASARDGTRLFYRQFGPPTNRLVITLHGSGSDGGYLSTFCSRLQERTGACVIAADLRGHGRSGTLGACDYLGQLDDDLDDLIGHLHSEHPGSDIVLVAHSLSAPLALRAAGRHPRTVSAVVLLAPCFGFAHRTTRACVGGWVDRHGATHALLGVLNVLGWRRWNARRIYTFNCPRLLRNKFQVKGYSYALYHSLAGNDAPSGRQSTGVTAPLYVLIGERDEAMYAQRLVRFVSRRYPHAACEILPEEKHIDLLFEERTVVRVAAWSSTVPRATGA